MKIVVVGIGQSFRGDDGAGIEIVKAWKKEHPHEANHLDLRVEISGASGLELLTLIAGSDHAILVDAVRTEDPPGTVYRLVEDDLAIFSKGMHSGHGWGVAETLKLGRLLPEIMMPKEISILAISIKDTELGTELSSNVQENLPYAIEMLGWLLEDELVEENIALAG